MAVVTEARIRSEYRKAPFNSYCVEQRDIITPSARQFLQDKSIELIVGENPGPGRSERQSSAENNSAAVVDVKPAAPAFVCEQTGGSFENKPVHMTVIEKSLTDSVSSKTIVSKTDSRIEFAGQMDLLQADLLVVQVGCQEAGKTALYDTLQHILDGVRTLLRAHVFGSPVDIPNPVNIESIVGMSKDELRKRIDSVSGKKLADASMGRIVVSLNRLRARIRETELAAIRCYRQEIKTNRDDLGRDDIVEALNELSDRVYALMLDEQNQPELAKKTYRY